MDGFIIIDGVVVGVIIFLVFLVYLCGFVWEGMVILGWVLVVVFVFVFVL